MTKTICLDKNFSTTRLLMQEKPILESNSEEKFKTLLFLPENESRKCEGGLRTKRYFKKSYEDKPLVSIITVVFNGEKYLERTIQSVIDQTYDNVEYIIIDGRSTDSSIDIIKKYENKIDYWVSEPDEGVYYAMNKGIELVFGDWVNFMNCGDIFKNCQVLSSLFSIGIGSEIELVYGRATIENKIFQTNKIIGREVSSIQDFYEGMPICHQATFHNICAFKKHGLFNESYRIAADYEWLCRFFENNSKATKYIDFIVADYLHGGLASDNLDQAKKEEYHISKSYFPKDVRVKKYIDFLKIKYKLYIRHLLRKIHIYELYIKLKKYFINKN